MPLFFGLDDPYTVAMTTSSRMSAFRSFTNRLFADAKGPWGSGGDDEEPPVTPAEPPKGNADGPWGEPPRTGRVDRPFRGGGGIDDFLRRSRERFNRSGRNGEGGGRGTGFRPDGSMVVWALAAALALWLVSTSFHSIAPAERGVVTRFGRYVATLTPGVGITLPSPIDRVRKIDVDNVREINLGSEESETLMLTGDGNIIDIAYQVRWNIRDPEQYLFELAQPEETIRQVAESAMRAAIANVTLREGMGAKRGDIENRVQEEMQRILDGYKSGVLVQGVAIKQADPPAAVLDAFKEVSAAQQQAQSYINQANSYALQLGAKAQGEAVAFEKVYGQYKLAPDVTRKRLYYETMERILQGVDKTIIDAPGVNNYQALPPVLRSTPPGATK